MSNSEGSQASHRALLESSVLLVTLLFVIASIRKESADQALIGGLAMLAVPFVVTMMSSVFLMMGESGDTAGRTTRALGMLEFTSFFAGLTLLLAMFFFWAKGTLWGRWERYM